MSDAAVPPPIPAAPRRVELVQPTQLHLWEVVFRVAVVVAILASLGLAWWTLTHRLLPLQKQSRDLTSTVSHLSAEVDSLERKWSGTDAAQIRAEFKQAHAQLFADEAELNRWLERLKDDSIPLALELNINFGQVTSEMTNTVKIGIIPASVSVEVRPLLGLTGTPYQRLLRLGQQLAAEGKRADLAELTVAGGTNSITRASLVFNLWAGEESVASEPAADVR